jgi:putative DNA primase/helicase
MVKETVRNIYHEAATCPDDAQREQLAKHAMRSEGAGRIRAMTQLAQSALAVTPEEFDQHRNLLNCGNGILNLRTGKLLDHDPKHLISQLAPVDFDPVAKAPLWLQFLRRIMDGNAHLVGFLQRLVGYSLTAAVSEQYLFLLHGEGANGKSTFTNVILGMLGDYGLQAEPSLLLAAGAGREKHSTGLTDLRGKRLAVCQENDDGRRLSEAVVKQLTGGDRIRARRMRQDFSEFLPQHKVWLATNHLPEIRGTDHGIWRRIVVIPFEVKIPSEEQDRHLEAKLIAELPGILNWALQGCLEWQSKGLEVIPEVAARVEVYRKSQDLLAPFIEAQCRVGQRERAGATELYDCYKEWCAQTREPSVSQRKFGEMLNARHFEKGHLTTGPTKGRVEYKGIGLADAEAESDPKQ